MLWIWFQSPYNDVTYELIGDGAAPFYFAIDPTSGLITIQRDISSDTTEDYQVGDTPITDTFPWFTFSEQGQDHAHWMSCILGTIVLC